MMYKILALFIGYMLAALFSSSISMSLTLTLWGSGWTYIILLFWWFISLWIAWLVPIALMGGGLLAMYGALFGVAAILDWWERR